MFKARFCAAAMFVMCAVGVLTTSPASAIFTLSTTKCGEGKHAFCWDESATGTNLRELTGEEEVTSKQVKTQESLIRATLGEEVHITCTELKAKEGTLHQTEPLAKESFGTGVAVFEGCSLLAPISEKCKVPTTIETKALMVTSGAGISEVVFKPKEGEIFTELAFSGEKCPATLKGKQPVKGEQICEWKSVALAKIHELECTEAGSKLKLGSSAATFLGLVEIDPPNLATTDFWDVELS